MRRIEIWYKNRTSTTVMESRMTVNAGLRPISITRHHGGREVGSSSVISAKEVSLADLRAPRAYEPHPALGKFKPHRSEILFATLPRYHMLRSMLNSVEPLAGRLAHLRDQMSRACERAGRSPDSVELLAVSKFHPPETVAAATSLGLTLFGENRVQEAKAKIPLCPSHLRWHLLGHLQSNKARDAVASFSTIQSVDSLEIAQALQKQAEKQTRTVRILLEVNVAGESSKFGWDPARILNDLPALASLTRLELQGLMTIAPYARDPEKVRPVFRRLRELQTRCAERLGVPFPVLSMGMSGDFEVAIEEGSTLIRIGTALFGERPRPVRTEEAP